MSSPGNTQPGTARTAAAAAVTSVHQSRGEFVSDALFGSVLSHIVTCGLAAVAYGNYLLFRPYFVTLAWSVIVGIGTRGLRVEVSEFCHSLVAGKRCGESYVARAIKNVLEYCTIPLPPTMMEMDGDEGAGGSTELGTAADEIRARNDRTVRRSNVIAAAVIGSLFIISSCCLFGTGMVCGVIVAALVTLAAVLLTMHVLDERLLLYRHVVSDDSLLTALMLTVGGALALAGAALTCVMVVHEGFSFIGGIVESAGGGMDGGAPVLFGVDLYRINELSEYIGVDVAQYVGQYYDHTAVNAAAGIDGGGSKIQYAKLMQDVGMANATVATIAPMLVNIELILAGSRPAPGRGGLDGQALDASAVSSSAARGLESDGASGPIGDGWTVGNDLMQYFSSLDYASLLGDDSPIPMLKETLMAGSKASISLIAMTLISSVDFAIQLLIFCTAVLYLATSKTDPLESLLLPFVPVSKTFAHRIAHPAAGGGSETAIHGRRGDAYVSGLVGAVQQILNQVVLIPIKMGVIKSLATIMLFSGFHLAGYLDYVFIAGSLAFVFAIVPILPVHIACLPWSIAMIFDPNRRLAGVGLFLAHQLLVVSIDGYVLGNLAEADAGLVGCRGSAGSSRHATPMAAHGSDDDCPASPSSPDCGVRSSSSQQADGDVSIDGGKAGAGGGSQLASYLSSFSVVLGVGAFGFQGILLGPLLVCSALLMHRAFMMYGELYEHESGPSSSGAMETVEATPVAAADATRGRTARGFDEDEDIDGDTLAAMANRPRWGPGRSGSSVGSISSMRKGSSSSIINNIVHSFVDTINR